MLTKLLTHSDACARLSSVVFRSLVLSLPRKICLCLPVFYRRNATHSCSLTRPRQRFAVHGRKIVSDVQKELKAPPESRLASCESATRLCEINTKCPFKGGKKMTHDGDVQRRKNNPASRPPTHRWGGLASTSADKRKRKRSAAKL